MAGESPEINPERIQEWPRVWESTRESPGMARSLVTCRRESENGSESEGKLPERIREWLGVRENASASPRSPHHVWKAVGLKCRMA